jgi:hypothetical protein
VILAYGSLEALIDERIERELPSLPRAVASIAPNSTCLAVVVDSVVDLAGFALFAGANVARDDGSVEEVPLLVERA